MKQLFVRVMLVCITTATSVFAESLDAGLGADRRSLSREQIAARSAAIEASTSFSLLRFPEALDAPRRIFNPDIWRYIEAAAGTHDLDPMILAGMIFIESYGDPQAKSPTGPAGIAQMTKGSARELGLTIGKRVRVGSKAVKTTRWVGTGKKRRKVVQTIQQPIYKTIDERYVPERAIWAMARRVSNRRSWLGGHVDFAIAEYHMGAGRMAKLLSAYFGRTIRIRDVPAEMRGCRSLVPRAVLDEHAVLPSCRLPCTRRTQSRRLFADVLLPSTAGHAAARDLSPVARRVREARLCVPGRLRLDCAAELAVELCQGRCAARCRARRPPVCCIRMSANGLFCSRISQRSSASAPPRARCRPSARRWAAALFVAHHLKRLQGERYSGFEITRMLAPAFADCASFGVASMVGCDEEASDPLHSLGWAFDIPSVGLSKIDQRDLKFILTDLRQAGLLAYVEDGRAPTYHVVRHPDHAARFEQFYWDAMAGHVPAEPTRACVGNRYGQGGELTGKLDQA